MRSPRPRLRRIEPIVRRALNGPCALPPGSRLLIAVSGGADSTALLVALHRVAHEFDIALHVAHLNHGLRAGAADRDQAFVQRLCEQLSVPFSSTRWDTRDRMKRRGLSGQAGLRTLRRDYLTRVARRVGAHAIATAHTADDQLETLLLRLLRGAGLKGLGGMSHRSGSWIKPLLSATRADIEADLTGTGQGWREDTSNRDRAYARTRVRHDVVPALVRALGMTEHGGPRARQGLARRAAEAMTELRQARRLIERLATNLLAAAERPAEGTKTHRPARPMRIQPAHAQPSVPSAPLPAGGASEIRLDSGRLGSYPRAVQPTLFRLLWRRLGHDQPGLTQRHLAALLKLVRSDREGARLDLPAGWTAQRERGVLALRRENIPAEKTRGPRMPCRPKGSRRAGVISPSTR